MLNISLHNRNIDSSTIVTAVFEKKCFSIFFIKVCNNQMHTLYTLTWSVGSQLPAAGSGCPFVGDSSCSGARY